MSALAKAKKRAPDLSIILGGHQPDDEDDERGDGEGDRMEAKRDAMLALMKAHKDEDVDGALEAHKALHDLHDADNNDDEDNEEEND